MSTSKCFGDITATDLRNENPEIDSIGHKGPILSRSIIGGASATWKGDWLLSDPQISPIFADLSVLRRANIKVDGVIAGLDISGPDALLFR